MSWFDILSESIPLVLSTATVSGGVFAAIVGIAVNKAKKDAEKKREERLKLEILRLEGEEKLSALLFSLLRHLRGNGSDKELENAIRDYTKHLETSKKLKNEIIGIYIER